MKKTIIVIVFATMMCQSLFGIAGFGFTYSIDNYPLEAVNPDLSLATLTSEASTSATGFGGYAYIDVIPVVDIELGFDLSGYRKYIFTTPDGESVDIPMFQKFGIYGTIQKNIFKLPMVKFYGGIGFSSNTLVPELNEAFFNDNNIDQNTTLIVLESIKDNLTSQKGYHLEIGARAKPWVVPVSFTAKTRYNFIKDIVPGKSGYLSIIFGAGLAL